MRLQEDTLLLQKKATFLLITYKYLLKNTKYETASTSRHDFGEVYSRNGEDYIKLNLQVRFR